MGSFWAFARRMGRHRLLLVAALVFATLSAGGLGAGLLGIAPILENILAAPGEGVGLPQLAAQASAWLGRTVGVTLPDPWIAALPEGRFTAVVAVVCALGVLTVFGALANFLHAYCALTVVSRTVASVRRDAFHRAVHLPLGTVLKQGTTDTISRVIYDSSTLAQGLNALLSKAVAQTTKGLAALAVALVLDWRLALVAIAVGLVLGWIIRKLGKRIRRASRLALEGQAGLYRTAAEAMQGLRVVKAYSAERRETARFHRMNKAVVKQELRVRTARALASPLVETLAIFVLGGLSLVAAKAIIDGKLDPKSFILVLGSLGVAAGSLKPLTGLVSDMQQASAAADRIGALLGSEPEAGRDPALPRIGRHSKSLRFENVSVTYPGADEPAVRGVDLTIAHGERVAFVGPNGSGKTTLLSLVPRLLEPDEGGRVLLDGCDIRTVRVRSVRSQIGVVPQDVVLFRGTIRENIAYGTAGADDEKVRRAARAARAESFILARPGGYEAEVGEHGSGFSGGQRQRLSIARAILRDPSILILDEATSMVDAESERQIAEAISEFSRGRTCLIVAHRLSTVISADRIVVMDAGRVVDAGRHDELLRRCDLYRLLVEGQLIPASGGSGAADEGGAVGAMRSGRDDA